MTIRQQIAENKHYPIEIIKCKNCHYHIFDTTHNIIKCQCDGKTVHPNGACKYFRVMQNS